MVVGHEAAQRFEIRLPRREKKRDTVMGDGDRRWQFYVVDLFLAR